MHRSVHFYCGLASLRWAADVVSMSRDRLRLKQLLLSFAVVSILYADAPPSRVRKATRGAPRQRGTTNGADIAPHAVNFDAWLVFDDVEFIDDLLCFFRVLSGCEETAPELLRGDGIGSGVASLQAGSRFLGSCLVGWNAQSGVAMLFGFPTCPNKLNQFIEVVAHASRQVSGQSRLEAFAIRPRMQLSCVANDLQLFWWGVVGW